MANINKKPKVEKDDLLAIYQKNSKKWLPAFKDRSIMVKEAILIMYEIH